MKFLGSYGLSTHSHKHCVSDTHRPGLVFSAETWATGYSQTQCSNVYTLTLPQNYSVCSFHTLFRVINNLPLLFQLTFYFIWKREKKFQASVIIINNTVEKQSCLNPDLHVNICYSIPVTPQLQRSEFHQLLKGVSLQFNI